MSTEISNARIASTYIGGWDESVPAAFLVVGIMFEGADWGQGSGHWSGQTEDFVAGVLRALEVSSWEKLPKQFCRIKRDKERAVLVAVGHPLKEKWYEFGVTP